MRSKGIIFVYLFLSLGSLLVLMVGCQTQQEKTEMTDQQLIERGKFLVTVGGCDDCHTPKNFGPNGPELNMAKRLSGHPEGIPLAPVDTTLIGPWVYFAGDLTAAVGPWGVSFTANLTPDNETGIGTWQPEMFIKAIKTGKHLGVVEGRPILPPMPWQALSHLPDEDLKAIFMYLKTLPAIKNNVPNPMPPGQIASVR